MTKFLVSLMFCINAKAAILNLTPLNTAVFRNEVTEQSVVGMQQEIDELVNKRGSKDYPIYLVLDCPGGNIYSGNSFNQYTKTVKNLKTITIFAASMCSSIVESNPGERFITNNGILMFHRAQGRFQGQFEDGEIESQLRLWKSIVRGLEQVNADRMQISLETYKQKVKDQWWLYGSEAIVDHAADQVVDIQCSKSLVDKRVEATIDGFFGSRTVLYSGCPLYRSYVKQKESSHED